MFEKIARYLGKPKEVLGKPDRKFKIDTLTKFETVTCFLVIAFSVSSSYLLKLIYTAEYTVSFS